MLYRPCAILFTGGSASRGGLPPEESSASREGGGVCIQGRSLHPGKESASREGVCIQGRSLHPGGFASWGGLHPGWSLPPGGLPLGGGGQTPPPNRILRDTVNEHPAGMYSCHYFSELQNILSIRHISNVTVN